MPENPTHQGLVAQGWNWTLADAKTYVQEYGVLDVGQTYTTESGLSEFDIELTEATGLSVTLNMSGTKDWGDGTTDTNTTHTYSQIGKYTIKCDGTSMNTSGSTMLFGQGEYSPNYFVKSIRIKKSGAYAFAYCRGLETVILMPEISLMGYDFNECTKLKNIILPQNCKPSTKNFYGCFFLEKAILSNQVSYIMDTAFQNCYSLKIKSIPLTISRFNSGIFHSNMSLEKLIITKNVLYVDTLVFANCYSAIMYDFSHHISIPTLAGSNAFNRINKLAKIVVPDSLYTNWIGATNWSTYASYIMKKSDWDAL